MLDKDVEMNAPAAPEALTVLYDGACPLCQREISYMQGLAEGSAGSGLCFRDVSAAEVQMPEAERAALLARFHVQRADGSRLSGAAAFVAMWARLPGWRWLAFVARVPGITPLLEVAYRGFLRLRPRLQAMARRACSSPR
jgi:ubiquinone biosynthesis monooxygenase Coq7